MCTLSFIPKVRGYYVAMNRDERFTRGPALPPRVANIEGVRAICPYEPGGGTWIAITETGSTWALLNSSIACDLPKTKSRGLVIPRVCPCTSVLGAEQKLDHVFLRGMMPFRLIAVFPDQRAASEWRWNGSSMHRLSFGWTRRHWFSSGWSDARAEVSRGVVCRAAWRRSEAGSLRWLRRLHRSHSPRPGPFSICVHRQDAGTLSYTEIVVSRRAVVMRYAEGPPCIGLSRVAEAVPSWTIARKG